MHGASVSKFDCPSITMCHVQVAFAMEKAAVMDLLGALRSVASKEWNYMHPPEFRWARNFESTLCDTTERVLYPGLKLTPLGKSMLVLAIPNTFLWSTCSEQRQTAVLHRFNFCMFCSKNSWTCVKQQGNQGSIVTHSKNLKDMFLRMFIHLHIHIVMLHIITR